MFSKKLRYISKIDANWKNDFNRVVRLALPLGIAQLISIGIMTSDIWIMGRLSSFDLAAGGLAIRYYQPFYFFALGMLLHPNAAFSLLGALRAFSQPILRSLERCLAPRDPAHPLRGHAHQAHS